MDHQQPAQVSPIMSVSLSWLFQFSILAKVGDSGTQDMGLINVLKIQVLFTYSWHIQFSILAKVGVSGAQEGYLINMRLNLYQNSRSHWSIQDHSEPVQMHPITFVFA